MFIANNFPLVVNFLLRDCLSILDVCSLIHYSKGKLLISSYHLFNLECILMFDFQKSYIKCLPFSIRALEYYNIALMKRNSFLLLYIRSPVYFVPISKVVVFSVKRRAVFSVKRRALTLLFLPRQK